MFSFSQALLMRKAPLVELPRVSELDDLYDAGVELASGLITMVAGRSGSQKSGFIMWLLSQLEQPALYIAGDMGMRTVVSRMAALREQGHKVDHIQFSLVSPITWPHIAAAIDAWVELYDTFPAHIVIDNLMDFAGSATDYSAQSETMAALSGMARDLGCNVWIMHHASDRDLRNNDDGNAAARPPARSSIKNQLSEKPELILGVALDPRESSDGFYDFNIAVLKNRDGASDSSGQQYFTLTCAPAQTCFYRKVKEDVSHIQELGAANIAPRGVGGGDGPRSSDDHRPRSKSVGDGSGPRDGDADGECPF